MATTRQKRGMVRHNEGAAAPTAASAADSVSSRFVVMKPGKANEGRMGEDLLVNGDEEKMQTKTRSHMTSTKEMVKVSATCPMTQPLENLPADSTCKGIKVTLDNNNMWNEFFRCKTEMILSKQGSRMFPYCRFRLAGLEPTKKYSLLIDIQLVDSNHYKWTEEGWVGDGRAERQVKSSPFAHPDSPATGQHWMQNPVSFYKLKLTDSVSDQEEMLVLHALHKYIPRLHVVPSDKSPKDFKLSSPHITFTFPQTEFIAVTAYQNSRFAQLKVDYNPFAKGLKEDGSSSWGLKLKSISGKDLKKEECSTPKEGNSMKRNLKSLLANHKPRSAKGLLDQKSPPSVPQKTTTDKDKPATISTAERSCSNARPTQKLFSELIREAHVTLKRCNLEEMGIKNKTPATRYMGKVNIITDDNVVKKAHLNTYPGNKRPSGVQIRPSEDDHESPYKDQKTPPEFQKTSSKDQKAPSEDHKTPSEDNKTPSEVQKTSSKDRKAPSEDHKTLPEVQKTSSKDRKAPSEDHKTLPEVQKTSSKDRKAPSEDHKTLPEVQKTSSKDRKAPSEDHKTPPEVQKTSSKDRKAPSKDRKAPSEDHKTLPEVQKTSCKDHKAPSKDHKAPSEDHKTASKDNGTLPEDHKTQVPRTRSKHQKALLEDRIISSEDQKTQCRDLKTLPPKVHKTPSEVQKTPPNDQKTPSKDLKTLKVQKTHSDSEDHTTPSEAVQKTPSEVQKTPPNNQKTPSKDLKTLSVSKDHTPFDVQKTPPNDQKTPSKDLKTLTVQKTPSEVQKTPPNDQKTPSKDLKTKIQKTHSDAEDHKTPFDAVQKTPSEVQKTPPINQKTPSKDLKTLPEDQKTPSKDHKTPTKDHKMPPKDHRTASDDQKILPEVSGETSKPHKQRGPLPALALFLKQHPLKPRHTSKPKSPTRLPPESPSTSSQASTVSSGSVTDPSTDLADPPKACISQVTKFASKASVDVSERCLVGQRANVVDQVNESGGLVLGQAGLPTADQLEPRSDCPVFAPIPESVTPEPLLPGCAPRLPSTNQSFHTSEATLSTVPTSHSISSTYPMLSSPLDTVLSPPVPPFTETIAAPRTQSPGFTRHTHSLRDRESSPISFEPLSPASSPDPLPSLDISAAFGHNIASAGSNPSAASRTQRTESASIPSHKLKWHTVMPPPDPFLTTFTSFQPTSLSCGTLSMLPSQNNCSSSPLPQSHSGLQQDLDSATCPSPTDHDQSLPFPAGLSPLALPSPLSPAFSSLDGDALSPTPSLSDLMHFFSTDGDLGMEVDFSNQGAAAAAPVPCPPPSVVAADTQALPSQKVPPTPATGPPILKKKRGRPRKTDQAESIDQAESRDEAESIDQAECKVTNMQPSIEEVEEQLFVSFTSKEALKRHLGDAPESAEVTAQPHQPQPLASPEATVKVEPPETLEERIVVLEQLLLRDLKLMKHRQVIHPVLQEVGLKLNLLDPMLTIDLQWLGVRLPIPPPGTPLEEMTETLPLSQGVSAAFISRTGKTTDVTQIKGWRDKFPPSETSPVPTPSSVPEAAAAPPASDAPSKNHLAAFCSDMLDEYLENEAKLIDERASSFSQAAAAAALEPVAYELPVKSTSYVRTLDSVLKKKMQPPTSTTSALISGFVPPSKRPRLPPMMLMGPNKLKKTKWQKRQDKVLDSNQKVRKAGSAGTAASAPAAAPITPTPPGPGVAKPPSFVGNNKTQGIASLYNFTVSSVAPKERDHVLRLKKDKFKSFKEWDHVLKLKKKVFGSRNWSHVKSYAHLKPSKPTKDPFQFNNTAPVTHLPRDPIFENIKKLKNKSLSKIEDLMAVSDEMAPLEWDPSLENEQKLKTRSLSKTQDPMEPSDELAPLDWDTFSKRKKKPRNKPSPQIQGPAEVPAEDMEPLESDTELDSVSTEPKQDGEDEEATPLVTKALLKQKDLEDGVIWEGRPRTCITAERAAISLTSLFTLVGFVSENPTAPIQVIKRRAPPCLNPYCRLGCVCGSLNYTHKLTHCGRMDCMLGCTCLRQKVVLLKNLDGSDSSHTDTPDSKTSKRKKKRRMKMAYVLKESVSSPAQRIRTLWRPEPGHVDPEPLFTPDLVLLVSASDAPEWMTCARIREFSGRKTQHHSPIAAAKNAGVKKSKADKGSPVKTKKDEGSASSAVRIKEVNVSAAKSKLDKTPAVKTKEVKAPAVKSKPDKTPVVKTKEVKASAVKIKEAKAAADKSTAKRKHTEAIMSKCPTLTQQVKETPPPPPQPPPPTPPPPPPALPASKRLEVVTDCRWESTALRNQVLMKVVQAMCQDRLNEAYWIGSHLITPICKVLKGQGPDACLHYKVNISEPILRRRTTTATAPLPPSNTAPPPPYSFPAAMDILQAMESSTAPPPPYSSPAAMDILQAMESSTAAPSPTRTNAAPSVANTPQQPATREDTRQRKAEGDKDTRGKDEGKKERREEEKVEGGTEDWQRGFEEEDSGMDSAVESEEQLAGEEECSGVDGAADRKRLMRMGLPFITGVSPAGVLSANKRQPGGTDRLVQVNGKAYPLAKIQLGGMGSLHPANRLAAYLTGRVGPAGKSPPKPPQPAAACGSAGRAASGGSSSSSSPSASQALPTSVAMTTATPSTTTITLKMAQTTTVPLPLSAPTTSAHRPGGPPMPPLGTVSSLLHGSAAGQVKGGGGGGGGGGAAQSQKVQLVTTVFPAPQGGAGASPIRVVPVPGPVPVSVSPASVSVEPSVLSSPTASVGGTAVSSLANPVPSSQPMSQVLLVPTPAGARGPAGVLQGTMSVPMPPPSQKLVVHKVTGGAGSHGTLLYQKPDGRLVQLIPLSQLRALNPNLVVTKGPNQGPTATISLVPSKVPGPAVPQRPPRPPPPAPMQVRFSHQPQPLVLSTNSITPTSTTTNVASISGLQSFSISNTITPTTTTSSASISGLHSFNISNTISPTTAAATPLSFVPVGPSSFLGQKGACTLKILPTNQNKEPLLIKCAQLPPQQPQTKVMASTGSFTLLQPPARQGALITQPPAPPPPLNVVSIVPSAGPGSGAVPARLVGPVPITSPIQAPKEARGSGAVAGQAPAPQTGPAARLAGQEPAQGLVDLDIVCVGEDEDDDDVQEVPVERASAGGGVDPADGWQIPLDVSEEVEILDSDSDLEVEIVHTKSTPLETVDLSSDSSEETDNSSDMTVDLSDSDGDDKHPVRFISDSDGDDEHHVKRSLTDKLQRHNALERMRRVELHKRFQALRKELGFIETKTAKITVLNEAASTVLTMGSEHKKLMEEKRRLMKMRNELVDTVSSMNGESREAVYQRVQNPGHSMVDLLEENTDHSSSEETDNSSDEDQAVLKKQQKKRVDVTNSSDEDQAVLKKQQKKRVDVTNSSNEDLSVLKKDEKKRVEVTHSSDEDQVVLKKKRFVFDVTSEEDEGDDEDGGGESQDDDGDEDDDEEMIDIESVETSLMSLAKEKLHAMKKSRQSSLVKSNRQRLNTRYNYLRVALNMDAQCLTKATVLQEARREIQDLTEQEDRLDKLHTCLTYQRAEYIRQIAHKSGKSEKSILGKLQKITGKIRSLEKDNGSENGATGHTPQQSTPDRSTPKHTAEGAVGKPASGSIVPQAESRPPGSQTSSCSVAKTSASHNVTPASQQSPQRPPRPPPSPRPSPSQGDRPRTVPNILSRRKQLFTSPLAETSPTVHTTTVMSLMMPQQIITFPNPTLLHNSNTPGVASVTFNIPGLTNQVVRSSGPALTLSHPPAAQGVPRLPTVLNLVQPQSSTLQLVASSTNAHLHLPSSTQTPEGARTQVTAPAPAPAPTPAPTQNTVQALTKVHAHTEPAAPDSVPVASSSSSPTLSRSGLPGQETPSSPGRSLRPAQETGFSGAGPPQAEEEEGEVGNASRGKERDTTEGEENLQSLLSEIEFLNQTAPEAPLSPPPSEMEFLDQAVPDAPLSPAPPGEEPPLSPLLLELNDDPSGESMQPQPGSPSPPPPTPPPADVCNVQVQQLQSPQCTSSKGGGGDTLTPPPLLQMKAGHHHGGGVGQIVEKAPSEGGAEPGAAPRWRPMPRLVPLGLRNNNNPPPPT